MTGEGEAGKAEGGWGEPPPGGGGPGEAHSLRMSPVTGWISLMITGVEQFGVG
jgi:hypothetical protein